MYLFFGDSNTKKLWDGEIEWFPGLMLHDPMFNFYLDTCSEEFTHIIVFIGTNDIGNGYRKEELQEKYKELKKDNRITIVGPYGDIDTNGMSTTDGIHLSESSYLEIGYLLKSLDQ